MITYKHFGIQRVAKKGYIVFNLRKDFDTHHTHVRSKDLAYMICKLAAEGKQADKDWINESIRRIV